MTATRLSPSGGWEISTIVNGYLVSRTFYGYSKRDAIQLFRGFIRADFGVDNA